MMAKTKGIALAFVLLFGVGCVSFQGGMPNIPFDIEQDLGYVKSELKTHASVKTYYDSPSDATRNKFVAYRLILINIAYLEYIQGMSAEESQIHSATDILVLTLDVTSAAVSPVNVKTVLSVLSSITSGVRMAVDTNAFMAKTMSALISSMNAQRKVVLERIIRGIGLDLNGYPFEQALSDINDYYMAGTIPGALTSIQREAGAKESKADKDIKILLEERNPEFLNIARQSRVDSLLSQVDSLGDPALFDLMFAPAYTNAEIERVVKSRDPQQLRFSDGTAALQILKMRIVLSKRDDATLDAWEAAVVSLQN